MCRNFWNAESAALDDVLPEVMPVLPRKRLAAVNKPLAVALAAACVVSTVLIDCFVLPGIGFVWLVEDTLTIFPDRNQTGSPNTL